MMGWMGTTTCCLQCLHLPTVPAKLAGRVSKSPQCGQMSWIMALPFPKVTWILDATFGRIYSTIVPQLWTGHQKMPLPSCCGPVYGHMVSTVSARSIAVSPWLQIRHGHDNGASGEPEAPTKIVQTACA
jgi:hypothetical protein